MMVGEPPNWGSSTTIPSDEGPMLGVDHGGDDLIRPGGRGEGRQGEPVRRIRM